MKLLPKESLISTSAVDHADWNNDLKLAYVMRRRFRLVQKLLGDRHVHRLLEVGFGSGVFMPELARRCDELYGVDVHSRVYEVQTTLEACGVLASLSKQDAANMTFPDRFFDAIVAVSALEFVQDINATARELARVLAPGGCCIAVMPRKSPLLDSMLRLLTGESAQRDYGPRRERVLPAMQRYFRITGQAKFPPVYTAFRFEHIS
jgi:ubiquinone/menaquinone biosynthesis C-methylase UbiE